MVTCIVLHKPCLFIVDCWICLALDGFSSMGNAGEMSDSCAKTTSALYAVSGTFLITR